MEYFIAVILLILIFDMKDETKIVLLDNNKTHNEIVIKNSVSTKVLDKTNSYVTIESNTSKPSKIKYISNEQLQKKYGNLISDDNKPISILLYFISGKDELANASKQELKKISKLLKARKTRDITIIGHTDGQGDDELNIKLSIKRAEKIANWIRENKLKSNSIEIKSYGEMDPIIPTKDGVSEPKNRRVEVLIR